MASAFRRRVLAAVRTRLAEHLEYDRDREEQLARWRACGAERR